MRTTLIALATAGIIASGGALAGTTIVQVNRDAPFVPVQYSTPYVAPTPDRYAAPSAERFDARAATVHEREARIRARIERGINDGRITQREARRLYRQLASIEAKERSFRSDGRIDRREDAELKRDLDRLAENVRVQLRDEERYSYAPYSR